MNESERREWEWVVELMALDKHGKGIISMSVEGEKISLGIIIDTWND